MGLNINELSTMDAVAQAELVRRRELTPLELVDAAIERIERVNPTLNAVITPLFEEARECAVSKDLPNGPFRGVPFLLKDLGIMQKGQPYYMGNRALRDIRYLAPEDTASGARFRAAGFITLGKTNTPEFGSQTTTQPVVFGATRNPWGLDRSTCGSSGGSSAAVAAGLVPVAHGNDAGGSIRLPAAWCGLVGLKPSRGRVPFPGTSRTQVEFVVTRSVRDVAGVLDSIHGNEPGELYLIPPPARNYANEVGADPGQFRIGMLTKANFGDIHSECLKATIETAKLLESLGHKVEESFPEALFDASGRAHSMALLKSTTRAQILYLSSLLGRAVTQDDVEPYFWNLTQGPQVKAEDYVAGEEWVQQWAVRVARWWTTGFELLLTPTVWEPAATLESMKAGQKPWKLGQKVAQHCFFTGSHNVTGQPAISLPLHWTPEGLPVGVQLVAAMGREDLLIRIASQIEQAQPWVSRRPPVHA
jgi:amidase